MQLYICTGQPHGCRIPQLPIDPDAQIFEQRRRWRTHQCQCEIMWNQIVPGHDMNDWMLVLRYQGSARSFDAHDLLLAHIHSESFGPWHPVPAMEMTMTPWHGHVCWNWFHYVSFTSSSGFLAFFLSSLIDNLTAPWQKRFTYCSHLLEIATGTYLDSQNCNSNTATLESTNVHIYTV